MLEKERVCLNGSMVNVEIEESYIPPRVQGRNEMVGVADVSIRGALLVQAAAQRKLGFAEVSLNQRY